MMINIIMLFTGQGLHVSVTLYTVTFPVYSFKPKCCVVRGAFETFRSTDFGGVGGRDGGRDGAGGGKKKKRIFLQSPTTPSSGAGVWLNQSKQYRFPKR